MLVVTAELEDTLFSFHLFIRKLSFGWHFATHFQVFLRNSCSLHVTLHVHSSRQQSTEPPPPHPTPPPSTPIQTTILTTDSWHSWNHGNYFYSSQLLSVALRPWIGFVLVSIPSLVTRQALIQLVLSHFGPLKHTACFIYRLLWIQ